MLTALDLDPRKPIEQRDIAEGRAGLSPTRRSGSTRRSGCRPCAGLHVGDGHRQRLVGAAYPSRRIALSAVFISAVTSARTWYAQTRIDCPGWLYELWMKSHRPFRPEAGRVDLGVRAARAGTEQHAGVQRVRLRSRAARRIVGRIYSKDGSRRERDPRPSRDTPGRPSHPRGTVNRGRARVEPTAARVDVDVHHVLVVVVRRQARFGGLGRTLPLAAAHVLRRCSAGTSRACSQRLPRPRGGSRRTSAS